MTQDIVKTHLHIWTLATFNQVLVSTLSGSTALWLCPCGKRKVTNYND